MSKTKLMREAFIAGYGYAVVDDDKPRNVDKLFERWLESRSACPACGGKLTGDGSCSNPRCELANMVTDTSAYNSKQSPVAVRHFGTPDAGGTEYRFPHKGVKKFPRNDPPSEWPDDPELWGDK